tara:strand:- start:362 stop:751 length:390 start_codon:yes stop_codon:yes gene_type:complete
MKITEINKEKTDRITKARTEFIADVVDHAVESAKELIMDEFKNITSLGYPVFKPGIAMDHKNGQIFVSVFDADGGLDKLSVDGEGGLNGHQSFDDIIEMSMGSDDPMGESRAYRMIADGIESRVKAEIK